MDVKPIFTTVIAFDKLDLDNAVLEKYCRNQISTFEKDKDSSISQSTFFDLTDKELQPLLDEIRYKVNHLHKELGFADDLHQELTQGWANINNSEGVDMPHSHPGAFFNAIYYVRAPQDSAELMLMSPVPALDHLMHKRTVQHWNTFNSTWQMIKPEEGMLVIMPSWIKHYVKKHSSSQDRISMAFDTVMLPN